MSEERRLPPPDTGQGGNAKKRAGVVLAPPSGQIQKKSSFLRLDAWVSRAGPRQAMVSPWGWSLSSAPPSPVFFLSTSTSGSFHAPHHQTRLFCHTRCGPGVWQVTPENMRSVNTTIISVINITVTQTQTKPVICNTEFQLPQK